MKFFSHLGRWIGQVAWLIGFVVAIAVLLANSGQAFAQSVVIAKFSDKTGKAQIGKKTQASLANGFNNKGVKVIGYDQYLRTAKKSKISAAKALKPDNVKKLSSSMSLNGVVTGTAKKQKRGFVVEIHLIDSNGTKALTKKYTLAKAAFPEENADDFVSEAMKNLGGSTSIAEAPVDPTPTATPATTDDKKPPSSGGGSGEFLPPWARTDDKNAAGSSGTGAGSGSDTSASSGSATASSSTSNTSSSSGSEVSQPAPEPKKKTAVGAVPNALLSAGMSLNFRSGLTPPHQAGPFPGIFADGRFFLGSFLDVPVVRDIGLGAGMNMSLALKYSRKGASTSWSASQMQWRGELNYRLAFNSVSIAPAFLFRFGFGSTGCTINAAGDTGVKSVSYSYPYGMIDFYLMFARPLMRLHLTGGFMFSATSGKDLKGSGTGLVFGGGLGFVLFDWLQLGLDYEMSRFSIKSANIAHTDTYHGIVIRAGWNFK